MGEAFLQLCKRLTIHARECYKLTNELSCLECPTHQLAAVDKSFIDFHLDMQVKELKKYQPNCSCYIVLTKSDLLEPLPKPEPLLEDQPKELLESCLPAEEASDSHDDLRGNNFLLCLVKVVMSNYPQRSPATVQSALLTASLAAKTQTEAPILVKLASSVKMESLCNGISCLKERQSRSYC